MLEHRVSRDSMGYMCQHHVKSKAGQEEDKNGEQNNRNDVFQSDFCQKMEFMPVLYQVIDKYDQYGKKNDPLDGLSQFR
jgi:hypothetical protein